MNFSKWSVFLCITSLLIFYGCTPDNYYSVNSSLETKSEKTSNKVVRDTVSNCKNSLKSYAKCMVSYYKSDCTDYKRVARFSSPLPGPWSDFQKDKGKQYKQGQRGVAYSPLLSDCRSEAISISACDPDINGTKNPGEFSLEIEKFYKEHFGQVHADLHNHCGV